jgi:hypothetical protein
MTSLAVLSEVNPAGASGSETKPVDEIKRQLSDWYDIDVVGEGFSEVIEDAIRHTEDRGMTLIVRDWPHVNFVPSNKNDWSPTNRLLVLEHLPQRCSPVPFAFVRDAIDVMLSRGRLTEESAMEYLNFVRAVESQKIPIFKFEDFCQEPASVLAGICDLLGVPIDPQWQSFNEVRDVHGDVSVRGGSRGSRTHGIAPMPRKYVSTSARQWLNSCEAIQEANAILGYPLRYEDAAQHESWVSSTKEKVSRRLRGMFGSC